MSNLTYERLRSVISYDPDSGIAIWLPRTPSMFKEGHHSADNSCASWNARNAGKIAGGIAANGYYNISIDGERYQIHRVIFFYMTERWHLGYFDCPAAAHLVAFIEADKHFGEFARSR